MSKHYVFSTLTAPQIYQNYGSGGGDLPVALDDGVLIQGGSNTVDKYDRQTAPGVVTEVTAAQLTYLRENSVFQAHVKNGFIVVADHRENSEAVAADMDTRSADAPLQPEDFKPGEPTPTTVAASDDDAPPPPPARTNRRA